MTCLAVKNISAGYQSQPVIQDISVQFAKGKLNALIGPNGCGKSSLLKAIMGFIPLDQGKIDIDGHPHDKISRREMAQKIAYLPQDNICPEYMRVGELIELAGYSRYRFLGGISQRDRSLFEQALNHVGLADMADKRLMSLSGGQRQRAFIAMVLAQNADIILLDEPVNHLDVQYQYAILTILSRLSQDFGKTIVTVLHDLNLTAAFADQVVLLKQGKLVAEGHVREIMTADHIRHVFDLDVDIFDRGERLVCLPVRAFG